MELQREPQQESSAAGGSQQQRQREVCINVRPPTKLFCGREEELRRIRNLCKWRAGTPNLDFTYVAITGPGGIGKSELAVIYANSFHNEEKGDVVWINAESNSSTLDSVRAMATHLGIPLKDPEDKQKSLKVLLHESFEKLSSKTLLILDNLNDFKSDILTELGNADFLDKFNPLLILTVNSNINLPTNIPPEQVISLDILNTRDAEYFLRRALNINTTTDTATEMGTLIRDLGGHPLTLHQAASYFKLKIGLPSASCSLEVEIRKYLLNFHGRKSQLTLVSLTGSLPSGNLIIYSAILISFDNIKNQGKIGEDASTVMKIISFLSPDNIPLSLLVGILKLLRNYPEDIQIDEASIFGRLRDNSLIKLREDFPSLSVHRLVQESVRLHLEETGETEAFLDRLVESFEKLKSLKQLPYTQIIFARRLWEHISLENNRVERNAYFGDTVYYLYHKAGHTLEAKDFSYESSSVLERVFGSRNKWTLKMLHWKAHHMSNYGNIHEALKLFTDTVYTPQQQEFGGRDKDCLLTARRIGMVYMKLKKFEMAYQWLQHVDETEKEEDRVYLYLPVDLAKCLMATGHDYEAFTKLSRVLEHQEAHNKMEENVTNYARSVLGDLYFKKKKYRLALEEFTFALRQLEGSLENKEHPHILRAKYNVAKTYRALGRNAECLALAQELLPQLMRVYGENHWQTKDVKRLSS